MIRNSIWPRALLGSKFVACMVVAAPIILTGTQSALAQTVIDTAVGPQVIADGDALTVEESGSITATGTDEDAVNSAGTISVTNAGFIRSLDDEGIEAVSINSLVNSGTIIGDGNGHGVRTTNGIGSLVNSGTIIGDQDGVIVFDTGGIGSLINTGLIRGNGDGIQVVVGDITSLTNHGSIIGRDFDGVNFEDTIFNLTNHGLIRGGDDDNGVSAGHIVNLVNSGLISGGTDAILEDGAGDTQLTLLEGSVLDGIIDLGGGINTLNVGTGLSLASTILTEGSLALELGTTNVPIVILSSAPDGSGVVTNQVASIDPAAFSMLDEGLADLTGGIFGVLSSRQSGFGGGFGSGFAAGDDDASSGSTSIANARVRTAWNVWGEVFGSYRTQDGSGNATDTTSGVGGLVIGADGAFSDTLTLGGFLGASWGQSETDGNTQETDTTSIFAGVYGAFVQPGVTYDFALVGGHSRYDRERQVANNLVAGGLETASADYNGWFLSPELTVRATHFQSFEPFVTLRYAGLFLDDVTETGTAAPLTLESQTLHLATGRLGITLPYEWAHGNGSETRLRLTGGVEARSQFGGTTQRGVLLGQSIAFEAGETDAVLGGFVGLDVSHQMSASTALYASGEALFETGNAMQLSARAGVRVAF